MRDVNASLLPNETVQFQYTYPLWLKIVAGAALAIFGFSLFGDLRTGDSCMTTVDIILVFYSGYWLLLMLRDSAQYVVTDRRVMRLGRDPQSDQVFDYTQIGGVRAWKDFVSGNGYVQVVSAAGQAIRIPMVGIGRTRTEWLAKTIDQFRGARPPAPETAAEGEESSPEPNPGDNE